MKDNKSIVILGAGMGGLRAAFKLEKRLKNMKGWEILLIDENDYHQYLYRFHELAGGNMSEVAATVPMDRLIGKKRIRFINAIVTALDPDIKSVETSNGSIKYDSLVIALGSQDEFFGIKGLDKQSVCTLKSLREACLTRAEVLDLADKGGDIVIAGGGFTGTELAGELAELFSKKKTISNRIFLVEALENILPGWNSQLVKKAVQILKSKGVEVVTNEPIKEVSENSVLLKSGRRISCALIIWAAGVSVDEVCGTCSPKINVKQRRICIDEYSSAVGIPGVYVIGDCALVCDIETGKPLPQSAHIALEQADLVACNIYAEISGTPRKKYIPTRVGEIVSLGGHDGVGELYGIKMSGRLAILMKKIIHLAYVQSIGGISLLLAGKIGKTECSPAN